VIEKDISRGGALNGILLTLLGRCLSVSVARKARYGFTVSMKSAKRDRDERFFLDRECARRCATSLMSSNGPALSHRIDEKCANRTCTTR
jgi:hypothetical protein